LISSSCLISFRAILLFYHKMWKNRPTKQPIISAKSLFNKLFVDVIGCFIGEVLMKLNLYKYSTKKNLTCSSRAQIRAILSIRDSCRISTKIESDWVLCVIFSLTFWKKTMTKSKGSQKDRKMAELSFEKAIETSRLTTKNYSRNGSSWFVARKEKRKWYWTPSKRNTSLEWRSIMKLCHPGQRRRASLTSSSGYRSGNWDEIRSFRRQEPPCSCWRRIGQDDRLCQFANI